MARTKGAKNEPKTPEIFTMTTEDRIRLLANLIIDVVSDPERRKAVDEAIAKELEKGQEGRGDVVARQ
jgi:hypothetical protein